MVGFHVASVRSIPDRSPMISPLVASATASVGKRATASETTPAKDAGISSTIVIGEVGSSGAAVTAATVPRNESVWLEQALNL